MKNFLEKAFCILIIFMAHNKINYLKITDFDHSQFLLKI